MTKLKTSEEMRKEVERELKNHNPKTDGLVLLVAGIGIGSIPLYDLVFDSGDTLGSWALLWPLIGAIMAYKGNQMRMKTKEQYVNDKVHYLLKAQDTGGFIGRAIQSTTRGFKSGLGKLGSNLADAEKRDREKDLQKKRRDAIFEQYRAEIIKHFGYILGVRYTRKFDDPFDLEIALLKTFIQRGETKFKSDLDELLQQKAAQKSQESPNEQRIRACKLLLQKHKKDLDELEWERVQEIIQGIQRDSTKEHTDIWQQVLDRANVARGLEALVENDISSEDLERHIKELLNKAEEEKSATEKVEQDFEEEYEKRVAAIKFIRGKISGKKIDKKAIGASYKVKKETAKDEETRKLYEELEADELADLDREIERLERELKSI